MIWELIYTSAPRGVKPGQSGFTTVAQTRGLRQVVARQLESWSVLEPSTLAGERYLAWHRLVMVQGRAYHVLSRVRPCGLDFSGRDNHLAHHLVFEVEETLHLPDPAWLARSWAGWKERWEDEPRWLEPLDLAALSTRAPEGLPGKAARWEELAGDAGCAALMLEHLPRKGLILAAAPSSDTVLELWSESMRLGGREGRLNRRGWEILFTTGLAQGESANHYHWCLLRDKDRALELANREQSVLWWENLPEVKGELADRARGKRKAGKEAVAGGEPMAPAAEERSQLQRPALEEVAAGGRSRWALGLVVLGAAFVALCAGLGIGAIAAMRGCAGPGGEPAVERASGSSSGAAGERAAASAAAGSDSQERAEEREPAVAETLAEAIFEWNASWPRVRTLAAHRDDEMCSTPLAALGALGGWLQESSSAGAGMEAGKEWKVRWGKAPGLAVGEMEVADLKLDLYEKELRVVVDGEARAVIAFREWYYNRSDAVRWRWEKDEEDWQIFFEKERAPGDDSERALRILFLSESAEPMTVELPADLGDRQRARAALDDRLAMLTAACGRSWLWSLRNGEGEVLASLPRKGVAPVLPEVWPLRGRAESQTGPDSGGEGTRDLSSGTMAELSLQLDDEEIPVLRVSGIRGGGME